MMDMSHTNLICRMILNTSPFARVCSCIIGEGRITKIHLSETG
jgi:hypothetical protein